MKIGILTIGQSPREDVVTDWRRMLGPDVQLLEAGLLDGLDRAAIDRLSVRSTEPVLVTKLRDGAKVEIPKRFVLERMPACVSRLEGQSVDLTVILCTEDFAELESRRPVIQPGKVIQGVVNGLLARGKLGVMVPTVQQMSAVQRDWLGSNIELHIEAVSPYQSTQQEVTAAATNFRTANVDLILLDCMGYDRSFHTTCCQVAERPVLLPRTMIARQIMELVGNGQPNDKLL